MGETMLKLIILGSFVSLAYLAGGRSTYSAVQCQYPTGYAFKFAPDPSNIWSFHESISVNASQSVDVPVLVDFDSNGRMDTEYAAARVLITDIQVRSRLSSVILLDNQGERWDISPETVSSGGNYAFTNRETHFTTPLALPIGSNLKVRVRNYNNATEPTTIHIVGRLVTL
jgi:hypothetical protein